MRIQTTNNRMLRRGLVPGVILTAAALLIAGCATGSAPPSDGDTTAKPAADTETASEGDDFCASVDGLGESLTAITTMQGDPESGKEAVSTARGILEATTPPDEIAETWTYLAGGLETLEKSLADDASDSASDSDDADAFAALLLTPGLAEEVGLFLQTECDEDLGLIAPAIADVCAAVDDAFLGSIFGTAPEGEKLRWSNAMVECQWEDGEREVGAVVAPTAGMEEIVQGAPPMSQVPGDGYTADVYEGSFGPLRVNTRGYTVAAAVGDWAILVSVTTGDDSADKSKAVALVGVLADQLP